MITLVACGQILVSLQLQEFSKLAIFGFWAPTHRTCASIRLGCIMHAWSCRWWSHKICTIHPSIYPSIHLSINPSIFQQCLHLACKWFHWTNSLWWSLECMLIGTWWEFQHAHLPGKMRPNMKHLVAPVHFFSSCTQECPRTKGLILAVQDWSFFLSINTSTLMHACMHSCLHVSLSHSMCATFNFLSPVLRRGFCAARHTCSSWWVIQRASNHFVLNNVQQSAENHTNFMPCLKTSELLKSSIKECLLWWAHSPMVAHTFLGPSIQLIMDWVSTE